MTNTEINNIVAAAKRGEDGATAKLYEATIEQALSYAMLCLMLNEHDAQDVVSGAYLAAFSKLEQYETGTNFIAWLFKIIKNKAIDRKRKIKTAEEYEKLVEALQADNGADSFTQAERDTALRNIIDTLPEKQREAVRLHYIDGFSVREVAERLDISENTAKTHIRRGFLAIKAAVLDNGNRDTWLGGFAALPLFRSMLKEDLKSGFYAVSAQSGAAVTATGAAAVAASKIGIGVAFMGLGTGTKIAISVAAAVLLVGGIATPMYIRAESTREQEAVAAVAAIQQEEAERAASLAAQEAELARRTAAQAAAERAAEEQAAEDAERIAAETAEAERIAAEETAEQERIAEAEKAASDTAKTNEFSQSKTEKPSSSSSAASSQKPQSVGQIPGMGGKNPGSYKGQTDIP